jgi:hypothetical protein
MQKGLLSEQVNQKHLPIVTFTSNSQPYATILPAALTNLNQTP